MSDTFFNAGADFIAFWHFYVFYVPYHTTDNLHVSWHIYIQRYIGLGLVQTMGQHITARIGLSYW